MTRIKICGITTPADAELLAELDVEAVGLNFYPKSPRHVTPEQTRELVGRLGPFTAPVGVFVPDDWLRVFTVAIEVGLRAVQTYSDSPPPGSMSPFAHIPAFRVKDTADLDRIRQFVAACRPAAVLVDSFVAGEMGGTGHKAPWELLVGFDPGVPLILAGGLTPDNVADAIRTVRPWGVDVASGVEASPGVKDPAKVRAFVAAVRSVPLSRRGRGGRRSTIPVALAPTPHRRSRPMSSRYWLGVDLGGTKILAGLFDDGLNVIARNKQPTGAEGGPAGVIGRVAQAVEAVMREGNVSPSQIGGMGFAIPGQIVPNEPVVRFAPNLDWRDVNVRQLLPAEWKWPVVLENDVRMGTYGEFAFGSAKGARHVFGVFVGTGVGGGFILNGELFTGHNGHAGEIGHIVVNWRKGTTLESVAGRRYQMKRAKEILDDAPKLVRKEWKGVDLERVKSSQLAAFYEKDDPVAVAIVDDAARAVAAGIASVINLMSPEVVVLGGGVTQALGDSFVERVWDIAQRYLLPGIAERMKFVPAALGDDSGITGCAAFVKAKTQ